MTIVDVTDVQRDKRFRAVERYYRERRRSLGDVYGWGPTQIGPNPAARILADPSAAGLPDRIGDVEIEVLRVEMPQAL